MANMKVRFQFRLRTILVLTALIGWGIVAVPYWWPICANWLYYDRANKRAAEIWSAQAREFWGDGPVYGPDAAERAKIDALSAKVEKLRKGESAD